MSPFDFYLRRMGRLSAESAAICERVAAELASPTPELDALREAADDLRDEAERVAGGAA